VRKNQLIPEGVAKLLLCGILSDTINLTSKTTTDADRLMCVLLTIFGDVDRPVTLYEGTSEEKVVRGPNDLACGMFKAKTNWFAGLGAYEVVRGDAKVFEIGDKGDGSAWKVMWGTCEVTSMEPFMAVGDQILLEMRLRKVEDQSKDQEIEQEIELSSYSPYV